MAKDPWPLNEIILCLRRISRFKYLPQCCACLFICWCATVIITFGAVSYASYQYTTNANYEPVIVHQPPADIPLFSDIKSHQKKSESSLSHTIDPSLDVDIVRQLLFRIFHSLQPPQDNAQSIDIHSLIDVFDFNLFPISTLCTSSSSPSPIPTVYGCFRISLESGHIIIDGTDLLSIISGLNYYLTRYWSLSLSWTGSTVEYLYDEYLAFIQSIISNPPSNSLSDSSDGRSITPIIGRRPYRYTYYKNVCTDSYSMAFWSWEEWEPHLDWIAMHGINLVLLPSLNELIEYILWTKHFKLSHSDLAEYFVGPAFLAWFRMGNLKVRE